MLRLKRLRICSRFCIQGIIIMTTLLSVKNEALNNAQACIAENTLLTTSELDNVEIQGADVSQFETLDSISTSLAVGIDGQSKELVESEIYKFLASTFPEYV